MVIDSQCPIFVQILIKFQIYLKLPILLIKSKESTGRNKWTVTDIVSHSYIDRKVHSSIANIKMQHFSTIIPDQELLKQLIIAHERHQMGERTIYT